MQNKISIKFKIILTLSFVFLTVSALAQQQESTKYFELENGLKIFLYQRDALPLLNIVAAVNIGSKDETDETNGLVHILEHSILFGGTQLRSSSKVSQDIRDHGAYFNAHTSRDLVTFDISLPSEYADFALKNQKEILFNLKLSQEEMDKEKKIILEELANIKDDPFKYASSLAYQKLYENHPYQNPIYGREEVIETATVTQMEEFYQKYFVPSNCSLAVVGKFNIEEMEEKVKKIFGEVKKEKFTPPKFEKTPLLEKTIEIKHEMDVNQGYLVIGMPGPDYNHPDQYTVDVLVQIIGRGATPMLGYALRGRRNLAQSVSMSYLAQKYGGSILIYIISEQKNLKAAKSETIKFLKAARKERYSRDDFPTVDQMYILDFLESAKNQIKFNFYQGRERSLDIASSLARFMLLNENSTEGSYLENVEAINSSDLREAAGKYLSQGRYVIVSILPKKDE